MLSSNCIYRRCPTLSSALMARSKGKNHGPRPPFIPIRRTTWPILLGFLLPLPFSLVEMRLKFPFCKLKREGKLGPHYDSGVQLQMNCVKLPSSRMVFRWENLEAVVLNHGYFVPQGYLCQHLKTFLVVTEHGRGMLLGSGKYRAMHRTACCNRMK